MVVTNNEIRLREIQAAVVAKQEMCVNINSISTILRVLQRNQVAMKQLYKVPFKQNSAQVKEARVQYVQRVMALEGEGTPHNFMYVDEAGFNLTKTVREKHQDCESKAAILTWRDVQSALTRLYVWRFQTAINSLFGRKQ
ncbi:hypothetical protein WMY93_006850 [Mugilogobius chulae]|uniref:Transposase n=1 Tax=Mugilogobius chulae TaxID=88201 RepID=A0AAW0PL99_9GOBI